MAAHRSIVIEHGKEVMVCTCGARAEKKDFKRFQKRHPSLCTERKEFNTQLAQGTRSVDGDNKWYAKVCPECGGDMRATGVMPAQYMCSRCKLTRVQDGAGWR